MEETTARHWDLMAKYLSGEITGPEKKELLGWLQARPERQQLFDQAQRNWNVRDRAADRFSPNAEAAWQKMQRRLKAEAPASAPAPVAPPAALPAAEPRVVSLWGAKQWLQIAAMLLVAAGLGYLVRTFVPVQGTASGLAQQTLDNAKLEMKLPDGSRIWLNERSTLRYAADFNTDNRVVYLEGEGYFEVKKAEGKPFTIYSQHTKTQVLGTSFNVRAYPEEGTVTVSVLTGKVAFSQEDGSQQVLLTPGLQAMRSKEGAISPAHATVGNVLSWHEDKLEFNNTPLPQVLAELEQHFEIPVQAADERLLHCHFTGSFQHPELEEVLQVLAVSLNGKVQKQEARYVLTGSGCE